MTSTDNKKNIIIYCNKTNANGEKEKVAIGAIQNLNIITTTSLSLNNETVKSHKLQATRVRLNQSRISEIFSGGFVNVASQIYPIQIMGKDDEIVGLEVKNVWITAIDYTYQTNDWIIVENMELEAESVDDKS